MWRRDVTSALLLAAAIALSATAASAQEAIGKATSVKPQAEGTHSGGTRTLSGGADVYSKETVRTGDYWSGGSAVSRQQ